MNYMIFPFLGQAVFWHLVWNTRVTWHCAFYFSISNFVFWSLWQVMSHLMIRQSFKSQNLFGGWGREKKLFITVACLHSVLSLLVSFGQTPSVIPTEARVLLKYFHPLALIHLEFLCLSWVSGLCPSGASHSCKISRRSSRSHWLSHCPDGL